MAAQPGTGRRVSFAAMLASNRARILERLGDEQLVLDVGGGAWPFERADWVIDLMPFERRGLYGGGEGDAGRGRERFSSETWVTRDICDHEPWPFADKQFDFAVCAQTLEDVRDPVWVCHELIRVARAGYIEVPSRLEEQSFGFQGPWAGWGHHRWLIDVGADGLRFVLKHHILHARASDHFDTAFYRRLTPEQRIQALWWEGSFSYGEDVICDAATIDAYLADFVAAHRPPQPPPGRGRQLARRLRSRLRGALPRGRSR